MGRITRAQHERQLAVFQQLDLSQPMTVSQARRAIAQKLGYMPGERWTMNRMREMDCLLSRKEALELIRCPTHGTLMNATCAWCEGNVARCPRCGAFKYEDTECTKCGREVI